MPGAELDRLIANAIIGLDTLWGGDVMCPSGTGRFIAANDETRARNGFRPEGLDSGSVGTGSQPSLVEGIVGIGCGDQGQDGQ